MVCHSVIRYGFSAKRSVLCMILIGLFVIAIFSGCQADDTDTKPYDSAYYDVSQFFVQYMEAMMHDPALAAQLCHFEDESDKELFLQEMQDDPTISYEIIRFEKLSDNLWVVEINIVKGMFPRGAYFVNYVGITDSKMLVYRNKRNLPSILTEGLVIEDYKPHGPDILD